MYLCKLITFANQKVEFAKNFIGVCRSKVPICCFPKETMPRQIVQKWARWLVRVRRFKPVTQPNWLFRRSSCQCLHEWEENCSMSLPVGMPVGRKTKAMAKRASVLFKCPVTNTARSLEQLVIATHKACSEVGEWQEHHSSLAMHHYT